VTKRSFPQWTGPSFRLYKITRHSCMTSPHTVMPDKGWHRVTDTSGFQDPNSWPLINCHMKCCASCNGAAIRESRDQTGVPCKLRTETVPRNARCELKGTLEPEFEWINLENCVHTFQYNWMTNRGTFSL